jgi:hypothetical protein
MGPKSRNAEPVRLVSGIPQAADVGTIVWAIRFGPTADMMLG